MEYEAISMDFLLFRNSNNLSTYLSFILNLKSITFVGKNLQVTKMNLQEFVKEYDEWINDYEKYDNGNLRIEFTEMGKCMWLKRMVYENLNMKVITSSNSSPIFWFEPIN